MTVRFFVLVKEIIDVLIVDNLGHSCRLGQSATSSRSRSAPSGESGGPFTFASGSQAAEAHTM